MDVKNPKAELEKLIAKLHEDAEYAVESVKQRAEEAVRQAESLMAFALPDALEGFLKADRVLAAPLEVRYKTGHQGAHTELRIDGQHHAQLGEMQELPVGNHRVLLLVFLDKNVPK